ncbi:MAG: hypothetical protein AAF585_09625, partial [Verrucomicrobiota bacterium]
MKFVLIIVVFACVCSAAAEISEAEIRANRIAESEKLGDPEDASALDLRTALDWIAPLDRRHESIRELERRYIARYVFRLEELLAIYYLKGLYSVCIELAAEICRPSLDPKNQKALQLLDRELEPNLLLRPFARQRSEWVRTVIAMQYESDTAYLYRLHGGYGDAGASRFGELERKREVQPPVVEAIRAKLRSIRIPSIEFKDTPVSTAIQVLGELSRENDPSGRGVELHLHHSVSAVPEGRGFDLELDVAPDAPSTRDMRHQPISLKLTDVSLEEALRYTTQLARLAYQIDSSGKILILVETESRAPFSTAVFRFPPDMIHNGIRQFWGEDPSDPFSDLVGPFYPNPFSPKDYLETQGITFPRGSSAHYNGRLNLLTVCNTESNLDLVEALVRHQAESLGYTGEGRDPAIGAPNSAAYGVTNEPIVKSLPKAGPDEISQDLYTCVYHLPMKWLKHDIEFYYDRRTIRQILERDGVEFASDTGALLNPDDDELIVRNTEYELKKVEDW